MKLGIISDIHGNIHALDAVLHDLESKCVELIVCTGDIVCYGANPNQVIQRLHQEFIPCVMGNYDWAVAWDCENASDKPSSELNEPFKITALRWTQERIKPKAKRFLQHIPLQNRFQFGDKTFEMYHAGPDSLVEWHSPNDPQDLDRLSQRIKADYIILGHTHESYKHTCGETAIINPGAVGRSLDGNTKSAFAILDIESGEISFQRIDYDLAGAVEAIDGSDMPQEIARMIERGARRVEEVMS